MVDKPYTASLRQGKGRAGWSIIFRHPARFDHATGKPGVRVHRGLSTYDANEAETLRAQLDQVLADPRYHEPTARPEAERAFDPRIVSIFFDGMVPERPDYLAMREASIPLPNSRDENYRRVLLLGTTGAGKTTLVRQLIGTDPVTERFPSTSTAKTTVHDTEIVLAAGNWRAVVTFASYDEVRDHVRDCVSSAVLAAWRSESDAEVLRQLLMHVNQRFRFNYVLGNGPLAASADSDDDEDDAIAPAPPGLSGSSGIDLDETNALLTSALTTVRQIASEHGDRLRRELAATDEADERVIDELFEEELDNLLRDDEACQTITDDLLDEIEKRFAPLEHDGEITYSRRQWPLAWTWETDDRTEFLDGIRRFSSNSAPHFGELLTPLVNGIRLAGPFTPAWLEGAPPRLVLLDGEGLGHTPNSTASVSTGVSRQIEQVDAVVLVDNAAQPMQAAPVAVMRELASSGHAAKLLFAFTHFDTVRGDNLPTVASREAHVTASAENVLAGIGEELGPFAERILRRRLTEGRVFLAAIDEELSATTKSGRRTIAELDRLLALIDAVIQRPTRSASSPTYDRMNLVLAVKSAASSFQVAWSQRLGLTTGRISKEHWTRIKALARRLAANMADEYDTLKPVADLRKELQDRIYVLIQNPVSWDGPEPTDEEKQVLFDSFAEIIGRELLDLATQRVWHDREDEWNEAFDQHGKGSTFVRARIIDQQIYSPAAPVPDVTPSPDRNQFLKAVSDLVQRAASQVGARLE